MKEGMMNLETAKELLVTTEEDDLTGITSGKELFGSVYMKLLRKLYSQAKQAATPQELTSYCVRITESADAAVFLYRLLFPECAWRESDASWSVGARNITQYLVLERKRQFTQELKDLDRHSLQMIASIERYLKGKSMNIDEAFEIIGMDRDDVSAVNATYLFYNVVSVELEQIKVAAATLMIYQDVLAALERLLQYADAAIMITNDVYGAEGANVIGLIEVSYEEARERIEKSFMDEAFLSIAKDFEQKK